MNDKENFSQSIIESEIDIKDENPFQIAASATSDVAVSDNSDIEVLAVCKGTALGKRNKLLRPIYYRKRPKISGNSVNNFATNNQASLIKEEIIISDESDCADTGNNEKNISNGHKNLKDKTKQDESLSAIILNCPRCNKTEKVFSITIKSNCRECDVSMYYVCNKCNHKYDGMPALYRHKKLQCQYILPKHKKRPSLMSMLLLKCNHCDTVKKILHTQKVAPPCSSCHNIMCYECVVCSKSYTSYSGIYVHVRRNCQAKRQAYYCNDCTYGCNKESTLIRHLKHNHAEHYRIHDVPCSRCDKIFEDSEQRKRHEILCGKPRYRCKYCSYKPKVCTNIEKHVLTQHPEKVDEEGLDNILISIANNGHRKDYLVVKSLSKNGNSERLDIADLKRLHCPHCDRTDDFAVNASDCPTCQKSYLFQCHPCCKTFVTSASLNRHIRRYHTEPRHNCKHCSRGFAMIGDLNEHEKTCSQERRYECQFCEFKTRYLGSLKSHVYKLHNEKRRAYQCGVCGITYKTSKAMKNHVKMCCSSIE